MTGTPFYLITLNYTARKRLTKLQKIPVFSSSITPIIHTPCNNFTFNKFMKLSILNTMNHVNRYHRSIGFKYGITKFPIIIINI
jgi:hypothetical protein